MNYTAVCLHLLLLIVIFYGRGCEGRQMCISCAFQTGVSGECLTDPWNWPMGNVRTRCNYRCSFIVHRDLEKKEFTYAYRGCSRTEKDQEDGCQEWGGTQNCYFSCLDEDYCNDWNITIIPGVEPESDGGLPSLRFFPLTNLFLALVLGWLV